MKKRALFVTAKSFAMSNMISRHTNLFTRVMLMTLFSLVVFGEAAKHHGSCTPPSPVTSPTATTHYCQLAQLSGF